MLMYKVNKSYFEGSINKQKSLKVEFSHGGIIEENPEKYNSMRFFTIDTKTGKKEYLDKTLHLGVRRDATAYLKTLDEETQNRLKDGFYKLKDLSVKENGEYTIMKDGDITLSEALKDIVTIPYVQKKYVKNNEIKCEEIEIDSRENYEFDLEDECIALRFIDKEFIKLGDKLVHYRNTNESNWIYFGDRMSLEEITERLINNDKYAKIADMMIDKDCKSVCRNGRNFFPLKGNAVTYEEYINYKNKVLVK